MTSGPYTQKEAELKCEEFQYLVGQPFHEGACAVIDCVVVAPYDEQSRNRFMVYYLLFNDAGMALAHDYNGKHYSVLLIAKTSDGLEMTHEDLHIWLSKNKGYNSHIEFPSVASEAATQAYC